MPRGDRTGPLGEGPMTGRGMGDCTGYNDVPRRRYYGRGAGLGLRRGFARGAGRGFGRGIGRGFARGYGYDGYVNYQPLTQTEEKEYLMEEKDYLKKQLEDLQQRLDNLENNSEE